LYYERKQSEFTTVAACGRISEVNSNDTNYLLTVDSVPILSDGVDVIAGTNPFGIISENQTATAVGSVLNILKTSFVITPTVGDYVTPTGKTCIPHVPEEMHSALVRCAVARCIGMIGGANNANNYAIAEKERDTVLELARQSLKSRIQNRPKKLISKNFVLNLMRY